MLPVHIWSGQTFCDIIICCATKFKCKHFVTSINNICRNLEIYNNNRKKTNNKSSGNNYTSNSSNSNLSFFDFSVITVLYLRTLKSNHNMHTGKHRTWLRPRRLDRPAGLSYASFAVSPQRSCTANFQLASLRPCLRRSHQPSLAACSWAHQVKSCRPGVQGPRRLSTVVPLPIYLRCRPTKLPRASLFLQWLPCLASGSPFHCQQLSIFGWWRSCMELPASGGHIGTIFDNLLHSTQDCSVHWVISWHSAHLTFLSTHCL